VFSIDEKEKPQLDEAEGPGYVEDRSDAGRYSRTPYSRRVVTRFPHHGTETGWGNGQKSEIMKKWPLHLRSSWSEGICVSPVPLLNQNHEGWEPGRMLQWSCDGSRQRRWKKRSAEASMLGAKWEYNPAEVRSADFRDAIYPAVESPCPYSSSHSNYALFPANSFFGYLRCPYAIHSFQSRDRLMFPVSIIKMTQVLELDDVMTCFKSLHSWSESLASDFWGHVMVAKRIVETASANRWFFGQGSGYLSLGQNDILSDRFPAPCRGTLRWRPAEPATQSVASPGWVWRSTRRKNTSGWERIAQKSYPAVPKSNGLRRASIWFRRRAKLPSPSYSLC